MQLNAVQKEKKIKVFIYSMSKHCRGGFETNGYYVLISVVETSSERRRKRIYEMNLRNKAIK